MRLGNIEEAKAYFIAPGAVVSKRYENGYTNLHIAARLGHYPFAVILLDLGADDPNAAGEDGWTSLHIAAEQGQGKLVVLLLKRGADREKKTESGLTPFDVAMEFEHYEITRLLKNCQGKAPFHDPSVFLNKKPHKLEWVLTLLNEFVDSFLSSDSLC